MNLLNCGFEPIDSWITNLYKYMYTQKESFTSYEWEKGLIFFHEVMYDINFTDDGLEVYKDINDALADYGWTEEFMNLSLNTVKLLIDCNVHNDEGEYAFDTIISEIECMSLKLEAGYFNKKFKTIRVDKEVDDGNSESSKEDQGNKQVDIPNENN